ncbi:MAG: HAD family hydrolase [Thermodesulfobacteriota bacterium]
MILIERPGQDSLEMDYLLIDFEGTLSMDRRIHPKAKDRINLLSKRLKIYIFAKGERERVQEVLKRVKAEVIFLNEGEASNQKLGFLRNLGGLRTVVMGNGIDDLLMMKEAGLSIAILGKEGTSGALIQNAHLLFIDIIDALDFLLKPLRQKATLGI